VVEQIHAGVVEWVRKPMARAIDGDHAALTAERREDRHRFEGATEAARGHKGVGPGPQLQHLGLALRPLDPPDAGALSKPREQGPVGRLDLAIQLVAGIAGLGPSGGAGPAPSAGRRAGLRGSPRTDRTPHRSEHLPDFARV
jgi:hypothetical protein